MIGLSLKALIWDKEIFEFALYDSYGRLLTKGFVKDAKNLTLDIHNYSKGVYLLNVKCGAETLTKKIVKI